MERNPILLDRNRSAVIVIDIQEKILSVMAEPERVVENARKLIEGVVQVGVPIFLTEQYPQGLGKTVPAIIESIPEIEVEEKITFSCCGIDHLMETMRKRHIDQVILCGIESHVCVWQTAMDFLHAGFAVYLVADATSSRKASDQQTALTRMSAEGVRLSTTEMVLFELVERAGTEVFKQVSKIIK